MRAIHPFNPAHDSMPNATPDISITRSHSGQRMWSDPVPKTQRSELARLSPFAPTLYYKDIPSSRRTAASAVPIAAAVCQEIPLRPLPSTLMAHYRNGSNDYSRFNDNIINSIHDLDLYEDEDHVYDAYGTQSVPRAMRQAPKLLTLDDYNLISLGYKPVMLRKLPWASLTGIAITAANVFSGIIPLYGFTVTNGGPAWATWSYFIVGLMSIIVSLCLSELASAYPTTAGVHHWVYQLGSARRRAYLSWMVGWFTIVSAVAVTASIAFYFASMLGQLLHSVENVSLTPATLVMFHLGALFGWQIFNLVSVRWIGYLSTLSGIFIVALAVALVSIMLSLSGFEPSMGHVPFTAFLNYSGSSSSIYAALSSTLMASFVFCPQDTIIRMAEESRRPERTMSRLIIGSTICSLLAGLPILIVLNYGITKPIKGLLDETMPGVKVILETLGHSTGMVFVAMVLVAMFCTGAIRLSMASRTVYSFARDGGIPRSSYWNHLHLQRKTPQRVSWLVTAACMCCVFPFFWGNTIAFQWIASLGCISSNICFAIPLWMRLTEEGNLHFIPGTFKLRRFSRPLHMISIAWLLLQSLFLMFPSTFPLSKNNFNYAPIVLAVLAIVFAISWFKARTDFTGGAKDVSRASHRIPPSRPFKDSYPRKQQPYEMENLGPQSSPPYQTPSHASIQKFNPPVAPEKTKTRQGQGHNFGTNPGPQQQLRQHVHRLPELLSPPRRGLAATAKRQQLSSERMSRGANSEEPSRLGQQQRGQHGSNLTSTRIASNQSHPSSILGIPFSESPEMISLEPAIKDSTPSSSPEPDLPNAPPLAEGSCPEHSGSVRSGLLLTNPFTMNTNPRGLPEISVAPLTTESTTDATMSRSGGAQFKGDASASSITYPIITLHRDYSVNGISSSSEVLTVQPAYPPLNAIDSIFNLGLGLTNKLIGKKSNSRGQDNGLGKIKSTKDRVPTPYPSSLEDGDDCGVSVYTGSMTEYQPPFPAGSVTLSTFHKSLSRKPLEARATMDGSDCSIEHIVNCMDIATPQQAVSRFPTLDGYPLLRSSSAVYMGGECEDEAAIRRGGRGAATAATAATDRELHLLDVFPLRRTLTIQQSDQEYGGAFRLGDSDEDEESQDHEMIAEADDWYEEHKHPYPVYSIPESRLHAMTPSNSTLQPSHSLFRLPNRDISAAPGAIPVSSLILSLTSAAHGSDDPTNRARPLPSLPIKQPQALSEGRHDPIERLLLTHHVPQPLSDQRQQLLADPSQQHLQRTRSVASWAQEQALIHQKRSKHRARAHALKELRGLDPMATLVSMHSDDSSVLSEFSSSSSSSPWSGVAQSPKLRKLNQIVGCGVLETLSEDEPLELSRLEIVIREQEVEEEEEELGMYMDMDGIVNPSMEVESLGAGVGRPSFR